MLLFKGLCQEGHATWKRFCHSILFSVVSPRGSSWKEKKNFKACFWQDTSKTQKPVSRPAGVTGHILSSLSGAGLIQVFSSFFPWEHFFLLFFLFVCCCWCCFCCRVTYWLTLPRCLRSPAFWKPCLYPWPGWKANNSATSSYICECRFAENTRAVVVIEGKMKTTVKWRCIENPDIISEGW